MENLTSKLTRTCTVCGIEKPLSSFLQLTSEGTSYGKVCAKCRSLGKTKKPQPAGSDDERSTAPSGMGIRGKEKIYADTQRDQKILTFKELYKKEKLKKDDLADDKNKRINLKEASEKKHREFYLDKKQSPLSKKAKTGDQTITREEHQKIISNNSATEQYRTVQETKTKEHTEIKKIIEGEEITKTSTNFNFLTHALETGRSEMQSVQLGQYFRWLGEAAPIVKFLKKEQGIEAAKPRQEKATEDNKNAREPSRRNR
jgi:hypothetical protein